MKWLRYLGLLLGLGICVWAGMQVLAFAQSATVAVPPSSASQNDISSAIGWACANQDTVKWLLGTLGVMTVFSQLSALMDRSATPKTRALLHFLAGNFVTVIKTLRATTPIILVFLLVGGASLTACASISQQPAKARLALACNTAAAAYNSAAGYRAQGKLTQAQIAFLLQSEPQVETACNKSNPPLDETTALASVQAWLDKWAAIQAGVKP